MGFGIKDQTPALDPHEGGVGVDLGSDAGAMKVVEVDPKSGGDNALGQLVFERRHRRFLHQLQKAWSAENRDVAGALHHSGLVLANHHRCFAPKAQFNRHAGSLRRNVARV